MADEQTLELAQLLHDAQRGNEAAFKALYDRTSPRLYAVAQRILNDRDVAEEVLQDTYMRIWRNLAEYRTERGQVMTWMTSILRYRAIDVLRARRPETSTELVPEAEDNDPGPFEHALADDGSERLSGCLQHLAPTQRNSIVLAFIEGLTHDQLAKRLDAPLGTIKSWIRRGLIGLRECLEQ